MLILLITINKVLLFDFNRLYSTFTLGNFGRLLSSTITIEKAAKLQTNWSQKKLMYEATRVKVECI